VGEGRLWERLRIYSGKYLFNKSKFYLEKFLNSMLNGEAHARRTGRKLQILQYFLEKSSFWMYSPS
jgi:hypothetical protein